MGEEDHDLLHGLLGNLSDGNGCLFEILNVLNQVGDESGFLNVFEVNDHDLARSALSLGDIFGFLTLLFGSVVKELDFASFSSTASFDHFLFLFVKLIITLYHTTKTTQK